MAWPPTSVPRPITLPSGDVAFFHFQGRYFDSYCDAPLSARFTNLSAWLRNWTMKPSSTAEMSGAPLPATSFFCRSSCWALYSPELRTIFTFGFAASYSAFSLSRPKSPQKLTFRVTGAPLLLLPPLLLGVVLCPLQPASSRLPARPAASSRAPLFKDRFM